MLSDFAKADLDWLADVLRGISEGAPALAAGDAARFMNAVALRTAPPRSAAAPKPAGADASPPAPPFAAQPEAPKSALQRLIDRFT